MIRLAALCLCWLCLTVPAAAHGLRVFATVEGSEIVGYGFFVGGGRPKDVAWSAAMAGREVARGRTDDEGRFAFATPSPVEGPVTVTLDAGDGHVAAREIGPERFGAAPAPEPPAGAAALPEDPPTDAPATPPPAAVTEAMIRTAVAREVAPLLERIEEMDARIRVADVVAGLCAIFGLAGVALWARAPRP